MAFACPACGRQFDATLFAFGRSVQCECGRWLDMREGHTKPACPPCEVDKGESPKPAPGETPDKTDKPPSA